MKIHIDTSTAEEKAKADKVAAKAKGGSAKSQSTSVPTPAPSAPKPKPNIPKSPPKEPKAPGDVAAARKQQSQVLKARQGLETQGAMRGPARDIDAGSGFWPPLSI